MRIVSVPSAQKQKEAKQINEIFAALEAERIELEKLFENMKATISGLEEYIENNFDEKWSRKKAWEKHRKKELEYRANRGIVRKLYYRTIEKYETTQNTNLIRQIKRYEKESIGRGIVL